MLFHFFSMWVKNKYPKCGKCRKKILLKSFFSKAKSSRLDKELTEKYLLKFLKTSISPKKEPSSYTAIGRPE